MPIVRAIAVLVPSGLFASLSFHIQQTYTAITPECVEVGVPPTFVDCWKEVLVRIPLHLLGSMCIVALLYMTQPLLRFRVRLLVVVLLVCYFLVQEFYMSMNNPCLKVSSISFLGLRRSQCIFC